LGVDVVGCWVRRSEVRKPEAGSACAPKGKWPQIPNGHFPRWVLDPPAPNTPEAREVGGRYLVLLAIGLPRAYIYSQCTGGGRRASGVACCYAVGGGCWCWLGKAADWIRASGCWLGDGVKIRHKAAAAAAAAAAAPRTQRIGRWGLTREPRLRFTSCGRTHHSARRSERSQGLHHSGGGSLPVGMSAQAPCCLLPVGPVAWCMLLLLLPVGCFPLPILAWGVLYATPSLSPSLSVYINNNSMHSP
jgi:hypothetical protein